MSFGVDTGHKRIGGVYAGQKDSPTYVKYKGAPGRLKLDKKIVLKHEGKGGIHENRSEERDMSQENCTQESKIR